MQNKQKEKNGTIIKRMYPHDYIWGEPQPSLKRTEVFICYGLMDGLHDSIILFKNGKMRYVPHFCFGNLDVEGIKKATK